MKNSKNIPNDNPTVSVKYDTREVEEKKKIHKKRKRRKHPIISFVAFVFLCVGIFFFAKSDFFLIENFEVLGNQYYTKAEIIEMSGLKAGYNLFEVKLKPARNALLESPYVRTVKFTRIPRSTLRLTIEERVEYAAIPYGDQFVIIDCEGFVLRISDKQPTLPVLEGMSVIEMNPGSPLIVEQKYLLVDTLQMLSVMDQNDLYFMRVKFSSVSVKAYIYDNYYCEGSPAYITESMPEIRLLVEEHYKQGISRGVIKVGKDHYLAYNPKIE